MFTTIQLSYDDGKKLVKLLSREDSRVSCVQEHSFSKQKLTKDGFLVSLVDIFKRRHEEETTHLL